MSKVVVRRYPSNVALLEIRPEDEPAIRRVAWRNAIDGEREISSYLETDAPRRPFRFAPWVKDALPPFTVPIHPLDRWRTRCPRCFDRYFGSNEPRLCVRCWDEGQPTGESEDFRQEAVIAYFTASYRLGMRQVSPNYSRATYIRGVVRHELWRYHRGGVDPQDAPADPPLSLDAAVETARQHYGEHVGVDEVIDDVVYGRSGRTLALEASALEASALEASAESAFFSKLEAWGEPALRDAVIERLGDLNDRERRRVVAVYIDGVHAEVVAEEEDVEPQAVYNTLRRAKTKLRRALLAPAPRAASTKPSTSAKRRAAPHPLRLAPYCAVTVRRPGQAPVTRPPTPPEWALKERLVKARGVRDPEGVTSLASIG